MKTLEDQLAAYAACHRDARNVATHFIGIPMIVAAVAVLLSRPALDVGGVAVSPAMAAVAAAALHYLRLSRGLGLLMAGLLVLAAEFGAWAAGLPRAGWLAIGVGGFAVGWIFQFAGHAWEGRKPAFLDDLAGLVVGPLFVVVEALFLAGALPRLRRAVEARAGKIRHDRRAVAATSA